MNRPLRAMTVGATLAALALLGLLGCGEQGEKAPENASLETFVGKVGPKASIAVVTNGDRLSGFVTDGKAYAKWFATTDIADDGATPLVARDGFELGSVEIDGDTASGEVQVALGDEEPFEANRVEDKGGLFTAAEKEGEDSFEAGWVLLPDGSSVGTYDTLIDGGFSTHRAPKLNPTVDIPRFGAAAPHELTTLFLDANIQAP